ncbi:gamma-glutamylcyclotransferase family protein [Nocardioides zhouii]|uniref:Gamma-glutamylcyclotransferase n=1 Tax=Nocardioides zhouii TaxID=1168729 RepID=A0A4Q2T4S5_9ACTN|nr:gamma-glutamylcyclotransferase family protein [Nocardioides zhouii]RYC13805.1 gamma-glutamylcyclotransferase [Nocardioides zhouii]
MTERLFVYGTLAPGRPNEHVLAPLGGTWVPAVVHGEVLDVGWGADHGYPALALRPDGPEVSGLVLTTPALADHWTSLDEFEGPGYERVLAPVTLASGEVVDAWLYVDAAGSP